MLGRAAKVGAAVPAAANGGDADSDDRNAPASQAELGDALLALVAVARANGWDAEAALRGSIRAVEDVIRKAEAG